MTFFSFSVIIRDLRSGPAMTRAMASSSSSWPIAFLLLRAARIAASLIRLLRPAPEKRGVSRARTSRSTWPSNGLLRACTSRMARRPRMSGRSSVTCRSKRPGRRSAGSRTSVRVGLEAIHLHQQLVEGLLALVVATAEAGAALAADGVDLIHEDDAGRVLLGLVAQVAHARGTDADEHLDELGARDAEEGHAGLPGDGFRQEGLSGSWRPNHEDALWDAGAERGKFLRELEELNDLGQLLLGLLHPGDVVEGYGRLVTGQQASST